MIYSAQVMQRARQRLASAKADRESEYNAHLQLAYRQQPRLLEIDKQLRENMSGAALAAFTTGEDPKVALARVQEANRQLQQERQAILQQHFAPGFLNETPICDRCGGSGYLGSTMCRCLQAICQEEVGKEVAILSGGSRFENFRLDYYPDGVDSKYGASPRTIMALTFDTCRKYAQQFQGSGNLLFVGGTGLGKTFLSACIATEVVKKGYSVAYESAAGFFGKLEKNRFKPDEQSQQQAQWLEDCDLLILDDLGTELPGNFVTAALYQIINHRIQAHKATVISTNLTISEIGQRYSPQIASRLQGEFRRLTFVGEDIRVLKNRGI